MRLPLLLAASLATFAASASAAFVPVPFLSETPVRKFTAPQWVIDPAKTYRAEIETTKGKVTIEFYAQQAPKTVNSFVFLTLNRYYEGVKFHRVLDGFVAQVGDPNTVTGPRATWGQGGPGYGYYLELDRALKFDKAGVLGMARTQDPYTNGSQFYITLAPTPSLDGQYTVFGRVVEGLDVVQSLQKIDPSSPAGENVTPDEIKTVTILVDDGKATP
ncbi:peptidylprolyl isomerase [Deinococcus yavapaiensis]|nr:peptidylprolyl isomerase [Deinococcus yavapaiensis]